MKRILTLALCLTLCLGMFTACGEKLPEGVSEDAVKTAAAATITALNAQDYAALTASMTQEMNDALAKSPLVDVWAPFFEKLGLFAQIDDTTVIAQKGMAVAVVKATYAHGKATFTLSYDADLKLAGLYFK